MKKFLLAAMLLGGFAIANAQNHDNHQNCQAHRQAQSQCTEATCEHSAAQQQTPGHECTQQQTPGHKCKHEQAPNPFEGIELTQAQKDALAQLRANCQAENAQQQAENGQQCANKKAERLNAIKAILTPEQYVKFLENSFLQSGDKGKARHHNHPQRANNLRSQRRVEGAAQQAARQVNAN